MRVVSRLALRRWALVAAGTALLCALPALVAAWPVPASALSAAQLRTRMMASGHVSYQGYAESVVNLDLPSLPDLGNVISLLDGTTDQYAWYRSPGEWRADQLTAAGENDIYQTARGTYLWDYGGNLLTRVVGNQPVRLPRAADLLPPALARRLLAFAGRADRMSRLPSQRVAGIAAAGVRIVPSGSSTTIAAVDIWADPTTGLPVQVEVFSRGSTAPALVTRFLDLRQTMPSLADVEPDPAAGVNLSRTALPDAAGVLNGYGPPLPAKLGGVARVASPAGLPDVAAYGSGLARFAVLPLPYRTGREALTAAALVGATIRLAGGTAVLVQTPLLTVLLAPARYGGPVYLLTGAVTASLLEGAGAELMDSP
jgi:hypothetical protein